MRAAVYLRQSMDRSGDELAVTRQRKDCLALCKSRGWSVVETYRDNDVSASTGKPRPEYLRMIADVKAGKADVVVVWDLDRLTRRPIEVEQWIELHERHGVNLVTIGENVDLSTDNGRMFLRIKAAVARGEVERKSARQLSANLQRAEDGRPPARRAYGWTADGMHLVDREAEAVRALYARLLAGSTLIGLARWLNDQGLTNTRGDKWQRNAVRLMLLNPRYKGTRTYQGAEVGPGLWPPIVPEETWQAARAALSDGGRVSNRTGTARKWLGSGLYRCGKCPDDDRSDMRVGYRNRGERIYRCRRHLHMSRLADPVDDWVTRRVVARLRRPDAADLLVTPGETVDVPALRREAQGLRSRIDSYGVDLAEGILTSRQVQIASKRLEGRLAAAEDALAEAGRTSALASVLDSPDPGQAWFDADLGVKRAVVDVIYSVVLLPGGGHRFDPDSVLITPVTARQ